MFGLETRGVFRYPISFSWSTLSDEHFVVPVSAPVGRVAAEVLSLCIFFYISYIVELLSYYAFVLIVETRATPPHNMSCVLCSSCHVR